MLKRILKLAISLAFYAAVYLWDSLYRLLGKSAPARCIILYYHSISQESRVKFARQLDLLLKWTKPIPADAPNALTPGILHSAVTFDDGFESFFVNALPELVQRRIPSTVFVVSGRIGRTTGWEGYPEKIMARDQLLQIPSQLVTIGAHTVTHPALPNVTREAAIHEMAESRRELEKILQRRVTLFSFPFGAFNQDLADACKGLGYERVFTTLPVLAFSDPREFATGRVCVEPTDWPIEFFLKISGAYRWLPLAFALKRLSRWNRSPKSMLRNATKAGANAATTVS